MIKLDARFSSLKASEATEGSNWSQIELSSDRSYGAPYLMRRGPDLVSDGVFTRRGAVRDFSPVSIEVRICAMPTKRARTREIKSATLIESLSAGVANARCKSLIARTHGEGWHGAFPSMSCACDRVGAADISAPPRILGAVPFKGKNMRKLLLFLPGLVALSLQGCASSPANVSATTGASNDLSSLKLFGPDHEPQFVADLACSARTARDSAQCLSVSNAFYAWANARHIRLHSAQTNEIRTDMPSASAVRLGKTYRVVIRFQPLSTATQLSGTGGTYIPGTVGYKGSIDVFDARTGALIRQVPLRQRQDVPDQANVTTFIEADANSVIARLDPAYLP